MTKARSTVVVVALIGGALAAGCGGGSRTARGAGHHVCRATIGFEGATGTSLGREQLAFAELAVADDNSSNGTKISLVASDTRLDPARAAALSDQFVGRGAVVAVLGPGSDQEVLAVGAAFARAGIAFISASATGSTLTTGANPTFFRVVAPDSLEGPQEARFIVTRLRARAVTIVDGPAVRSRELSASMLPVFRALRVPAGVVSAGARNVAPASVASRISLRVPAVALTWTAPGAAEHFGRTLLLQRKTPVIVGNDRLYAPGRFTLPGAYVTAYGPDITAVPGDAAIVLRIRRSLPSFGIAGPPAYAAAHVIDQAIAGICRSGQAPSRSGVLQAVRRTNESRSILGMPIRFQGDGELANARWFLYRIDAAGDYRLVPVR